MASRDAKEPQFDGTNFTFWKVRIEIYLMSLGVEVWKCLIDGYKIPSLPTNLDKNKAYVENSKALNSIASDLSYS